MVKKRDPSFEKNISTALAALAADSNLSLNRVSNEYGISRHTLGRRRNNGLSRHQAHEPRQLLSIKQEGELIKWISQLVAVGKPPTHAVIQQMAGYVAVQNGHSTHIGKRWILRFQKRHPECFRKRAARKDSDNIEDS